MVGSTNDGGQQDQLKAERGQRSKKRLRLCSPAGGEIDLLRGIADGLEPIRLWHLHKGDGPTVGLALHAGYEIRPDLLPLMRIDESTRLREEDPYTDNWTLACHNQLLTRRSRFEVDLNRKPSDAICVQPEDCWNLDVWRKPVDETVVLKSLAEHAAFYQALHHFLAEWRQLAA